MTAVVDFPGKNKLFSLFKSTDPQLINQALYLLHDIDIDGSIHDELIATSSIHYEEEYLRHSACVEGPLAQHCNHSIIEYDALYDCYITDDYTFPELFYRVLAQSPGGRSAEMRDEMTHIYLKYAAPTTEPTQVFDLSILQHFPSLKWLKIEYEHRNSDTLETLSLDYLSVRRYGETLPLPSSLKRLILVETPPAFDLTRTPHLIELELDYFATSNGCGFEALHHLDILRLHIPKALSAQPSFKVLLANNARHLKELRLKGMDAFEQTYPLPELRKALILCDHVALKEIPELEDLTIFAKFYTIERCPKLIEFTTHTYIDVRFLSESPKILKVCLYYSGRSQFSFPDLPSLEELIIEGVKNLSFLPALNNVSVLEIDKYADINTVPKHLVSKVQR